MGPSVQVQLMAYAADSWFPVAAPEELVRGEIDDWIGLIVPYTHTHNEK
jgi:hypothetical protein